MAKRVVKRMTFDDGVLEIYETKNISNPGMKPETILVLKDKYYFGYESIGVTRHYAAKQVKSKISNIVHVLQDRAILGEDICMLEDGLQYKCDLIQHTINEDGLPITRITLERLGEDYAISKDL